MTTTKEPTFFWSYEIGRGGKATAWAHDSHDAARFHAEKIGGPQARWRGTSNRRLTVAGLRTGMENRGGVVSLKIHVPAHLRP